MIDLAALDALLDEHYPKEWREIATFLYSGLLEHGQFAGDARPCAALAFNLTEWLRDNMGSGQIYLGKGQRYALSRRNRAIFDAWRGNNIKQLARDYQLTQRQVYEIIKSELAAARTRAQPDMFD